MAVLKGGVKEFKTFLQKSLYLSNASVIQNKGVYLTKIFNLFKFYTLRKTADEWRHLNLITTVSFPPYITIDYSIA